jgi:hypothetical protein
MSTGGSWVMIEAAPLEGTREGEIAVNLRAATASETFDLLCRASALSQRERQVAFLVAGHDTRPVTERLGADLAELRVHGCRALGCCCGAKPACGAAE